MEQNKITGEALFMVYIGHKDNPKTSSFPTKADERTAYLQKTSEQVELGLRQYLTALKKEGISVKPLVADEKLFLLIQEMAK